MPQKGISKWIIVIVFGALVKIFSFFPAGVERYYANGVYPYISATQRILFGWIPFSIGDIFYIVISIFCLRKIYLFFKAMFRKQLTKKEFVLVIEQVLFVCFLIYVLFNLLWGLNYNRQPMARQMGLHMERYTTESLADVVSALIGKLNSFDSTERFRPQLKKKKTLFHETLDTYAAAAKEYPPLKYGYTSVKPSLFSYAGNYMGFTGYYNPFTGEAQVNTTVPSFVQPFTTCHEIGHQLGYAKENEANFAGFLAARTSPNPAFRYSLYFDLYSYAIRELYLRDSSRVKSLRDQLNPNVKEDFNTIRKFYRRYENPFEPLIRKLYGNYLRANEQPQGMKSYDEVVAMLVAYYKSYGYI